MPAHRLRNFLLMVAMHDYYYCILTGASPLLHKDKVPAVTNFRANLEEISWPRCKTLKQLFGAVRQVGAPEFGTPLAKTIYSRARQRVFSFSILLYDLFTFFSFYKILKNSNCGALLFFVFYTCAKNIVVLII